MALHIRLGESVAAVGHGKGAIRLRRHLDPIGRRVCRGRRGRAATTWGARSASLRRSARCGSRSGRRGLRWRSISRNSGPGGRRTTTGPCSARPAALKLQTDVLHNIDRIPQRYREQLQSAANGLAFRIPECLPPKEDHGKHKGRRKHKKHGDGD